MIDTTPVRRAPRGFVHVPAEIMDRHPSVYVLKVTGDSMTGDRIYDGDYVLVDPAEQSHDGDIAAVWLTNWPDAETGKLCQGRVLKRLRCNGTVLESSNPAYKPMVLRPEHHAVVEGRVVGQIHNLGDGSAE